MELSSAYPLPEPDEALQEALMRHLLADPDLARLLDASEVRALTIGELLDAVGSPGEGRPHRHLRPIPGALESGRAMRARLSDRELEVVRLIVEGLSNKEIGTRLKLSDKTVKNHISHILAKLSLTARTQVAVLALRGGVA